MARQREGDTSTFHFIDNLSRSIRQLGSIVLELIPHVYDKQRIMRIMGEDGTPSNIPLNQPVVETKQGYIPKQAAQENGIEGIERIFDLTIGQYDVVVSSGPSYTSRREEAATQMTEFIRVFPQAASVIGDLLAKNLDWPGADDVAERLKKINPVLQQEERGNQPDPEAVKAQQEAQAKQQEMQFGQQESQMDLQMKRMDLEIKKIDLEAERQKAQVEIARASQDSIYS